MTEAPFAGLSPAPDTGHARWVVESMQGRDGVALVVPAGFDAYARLLHPLPDGRPWETVAPEYLGPGDAPYRYPFPEDVSATEGDAGPVAVDALLPVLEGATTTPERCHFGLWVGWGELHPGSHSTLYPAEPGRSPLGVRRHRRELRAMEHRQRDAAAPVTSFVAACPRQPWWGGRDMLLFDGPLPRVAGIGTPDPSAPGLRRRGPQWWWPADRSWFVATEIDHPWTYVGGTPALVEAVASHPELEAVPVAPDDRW